MAVLFCWKSITHSNNQNQKPLQIILSPQTNLQVRIFTWYSAL